FMRDRAKLVVSHAERADDSRVIVTIFVANQGRQPIAITEVGLRQRRRLRRSLRLRLASWLHATANGAFILLRKVGVSGAMLARWYRIIPDPPSAIQGQWWTALDQPTLLGIGELRTYELDMPEASDAEMFGTEIPIYAY